VPLAFPARKGFRLPVKLANLSDRNLNISLSQMILGDEFSYEIAVDTRRTPGLRQPNFGEHARAGAARLNPVPL
jgi:hypothetical protein